MKEAGVDRTEIDTVATDKKRWKEVGTIRMEHLETYERSKGNLRNEEIQSNTVRQKTENDMVCKVENCGKICESKAGLKIHQKRMHREVVKEFRYRCRMVFGTESTLINHMPRPESSNEEDKEM